VGSALQRPACPPSLSALVVAADGPAVERLRHRAEAAVNPASVMKLVTTYAALDMLGPDLHLEHRFYTDGEVVEGVLRGNLYVRGGGDPKLVLERLQEAFISLQDKGVRVILGDMVLDHSAFELPPRPGRLRRRSPAPLQRRARRAAGELQVGGAALQPDLRNRRGPCAQRAALEGLAIDATVPLARLACGDWRGALRARFDDANRIRFEGPLPQSCGERQWPVAYQDPASYAARAMEGLWRATGGSITGQVRTGLTPPGAACCTKPGRCRCRTSSPT
jgi:serine-type D-Ala-D-Ala carboxypeptidase/endopeptidase (penicillin-binding protein 4)